MEASKTNVLAGPGQFQRINDDEQQPLVKGRNIAAADALPGGKIITTVS